MRHYLVIAVGAAAGANCRFLVANLMAARFGDSFPYGTLLINVSGSFVIGVLATILTSRSVPDPTWRLLLITGFLGAYTTFSSLTYESLALIQDGAVLRAIGNLFGSLVAGMVAVVAGSVVGRLLT